MAVAGASLLAAFLPANGSLAATNGTARPVMAIGASSTAATAIAAGSDHTCALLAGGTVDCWGNNALGQLGNGTTTNSSTPVAVSGITTATAIAVGEAHTCALLADGTVDCWGNNGTGQLGDGTTTDSSTPVAVIGIKGVTAIAAAGASYGEYTCAVVAGGSVECWGYNGYGQLGDGTKTDSLVPVTVSGITGATAIASTLAYMCALLASGTVACWGGNEAGQLGNGTLTSSLIPVVMSGISGATAVAVGGDHTCALLAGGRVDCWGSNEFGQLGNGTTTNSSTPIAAGGLTTAIAMAAGGFHTCALLAAGTVDCWGENQWGQLGNGTLVDSPTLVAVRGIAGVTAVAAGWYDTCAIIAGGSVKCWGYNSDGQLGSATTTNSSTPVPVVGLTGSATPGLTYGWLAKVGSLGVNGTASLAVVTPSAGSIGLKLVKLKASSTLPVTLYKGTCSSVGSVLFRLSSITTTRTGTASRTSALTAAQVKVILGATAGTGRIAIRVGSGSASKCGAFAKRSVLGPQAVVQAFYKYYLVDSAFPDLVGRPDVAPSFIRWLKTWTQDFNPIVCAQGNPDSVQAGPAVISGSSAIVPDTEVWNGVPSPTGSGPTVTLALAPTGWQITAIACGSLPLP